jgi:Ca2+-binding EF-hand superfamily protein
MKTKMKLAIVLGGALITGVAAAQGIGSGSAQPHDRKAMFEKFDTNKDGKLDDQEKAALHTAMQAKHDERKAQMLAKYDTNKDGKLDDTERTAARNEKLAETFKTLDTDGNGQLSLSEFQAGKHGRGGHGGFGHQGRRGGMQRHGGMNRDK